MILSILLFPCLPPLPHWFFSNGPHSFFYPSLLFPSRLCRLFEGFRSGLLNATWFVPFLLPLFFPTLVTRPILFKIYRDVT